MKESSAPISCSGPYLRDPDHDDMHAFPCTDNGSEAWLSLACHDGFVLELFNTTVAGIKVVDGKQAAVQISNCSSVSVHDSHFERIKKATALKVLGAQHVEILNSSFVNNSASMEGAALYVIMDSGSMIMSGDKVVGVSST